MTKRGKDRDMLREIGSMYDIRARQHLGNIFTSKALRMQEKTRSGATKLNAGRAAVKAFLGVRSVMKEVESHEKERLKVQSNIIRHTNMKICQIQFCNSIPKCIKTIFKS